MVALSVRRRVPSMMDARASRAFLGRFGRDQRGATAIEYGLIAALIALVVISGVTNVGTNLSKKFSNVANAVK
jgi:pilus assembly protein Flp/PilA